MSDQGLVDMLDDLHSTRMKLRLAAARRRRWPVAERKEAVKDVHKPLQLPSAFDDDEGIPSGGYQ